MQRLAFTKNQLHFMTTTGCNLKMNRQMEFSNREDQNGLEAAEEAHWSLNESNDSLMLDKLASS